VLHLEFDQKVSRRSCKAPAKEEKKIKKKNLTNKKIIANPQTFHSVAGFINAERE
jgi:hypothetical protein